MTPDERLFLTHVRQLVETCWIQHDFACNEWGNPCHPLDDGAVGFCLLGAGVNTNATLKTAVSKPRFAELLALPELASWNDEKGRTVKDVLKRLDKALEVA